MDRGKADYSAETELVVPLMPARKLRRDQLPQIRLDKSDAWIIEVDYLKSIDELLLWLPSQKSKLKAFPPNLRKGPKDSEAADIPKLLVCHDFKGGYTEDLFERGYSFEFWHLVDTFIYFSHNRVTIPPRGWIESGHRRGIKVLGTLIFEWEESKPDLSKCLYQGTPYKAPNSDQVTFALDSAIKLIQLAEDRNFDGYLLNIETDLNFLPPEEFYPGGKEEKDEDEKAFLEEQKLSGVKAVITPSLRKTRIDRMQKNALAIENWTAYIREEGKRRVGPHFEIMWYDSVTTAGNLEWQDALTPLNSPFFMAAGNIFTNYTWASPPPPAPPGSFPPTPERKYHPKLLQSFEIAKSLSQSPSNVFEGIDVFGRNCYGGFDICKSLDMIFPTDLPPLGLSVAIFAPGWTWERAKDDGTERSWTEWWNDDLRLWVGPRDSSSNYSPVGAYFGTRQRSRSYRGQTDVYLPFYTNFSRGSGNSWWMFGRKVYDSSIPNDQLGRCGWTDIGASFPMPDRLWPQARILLPLINECRGSGLVDVTLDNKDWALKDVTMSELDIWEGSTCLKFTLTTTLNDISIPPFILPISTLQASNLSEGENFIVIMTKILGASEESTILPYILWADDKPSDGCLYQSSSSSTILSQNHIANGWVRTEVAATVQFSPNPCFITPVIGLQIISLGRDKTSSHSSVDCLIGSITVLPIDIRPKVPSLKQGVANWKPLESSNDDSQIIWGILSWGEEEIYPHSGYFDILVSGLSELDICNAREDTYLWLGSSTSERKRNSFVVSGLDLAEVPNYSKVTGTITFYVTYVGIPTEKSQYKLTLETPT